MKVRQSDHQNLQEQFKAAVRTSGSQSWYTWKEKTQTYIGLTRHFRKRTKNYSLKIAGLFNSQETASQKIR